MLVGYKVKVRHAQRPKPFGPLTVRTIVLKGHPQKGRSRRSKAASETENKMPPIQNRGPWPEHNRPAKKDCRTGSLKTILPGSFIGANTPAGSSVSIMEYEINKVRIAGRDQVGKILPGSFFRGKSTQHSPFRTILWIFSGIVHNCGEQTALLARKLCTNECATQNRSENALESVGDKT